MTKTFLTTVFFLILCPFGFSQTFDKATLDAYFQKLETNNKFMGSVAVSKNGKIIYTKTTGFVDVENKIKANENSKYRIGSISKSFTTVLILKAVEEKKINLSQTLDKWYPTIQNANKITVKQLLGHRSGIHNFTNDKDYLTWNTQPKTEKEMVAIIEKGGSDFEPDSKATYSNSNYVLLTYILEKTYSKSFAQLLQKYIVQPIGLTHTSVFGKINPNANECKSYNFAGSWILQSETDFSIPQGAGCILSTPSDLIKFSEALFGGKLLKPENLELMKSIKEGYGIGLFPIPFHSSKGYGHTGGIDGFSSVYAHFDDESISYALVSNGANFNVNEISIAVLSAVYNKPYEIPSFSTYAMSADELEPYLGIYASSQIALKITITKDGNTLIAQATGQQAFPLEATAKDTFKLDLVNAKFEFNPSEKSLMLFQGGGQIKFTKE